MHDDLGKVAAVAAAGLRVHDNRRFKHQLGQRAANQDKTAVLGTAFATSLRQPNSAVLFLDLSSLRRIWGSHFPRMGINMRILIAEDDVVTGRFIAESLLPWDYEPILVHDGLEAMAAMGNENAPPIVLLDWKMPGLDGIDVCRQIRQIVGRPYTYIVLLTGMTGRETMLAGLDAGADDFLVKPVDSQELRARLNAGRRIVVLQQQLLEAQQQLYAQATHDGLTGLWNRTAILDMLDRETGRSAREGHSLAIILMDLDHFKRINDTHGHLVGDKVLRETAFRLGSVLRPYDTLGRYGGEEFLVVLPGFDAAMAMSLAERLKKQIAELSYEERGVHISVTLSLGIAIWSKLTGTPITLLQLADAALYQAKATGRNRALLATPADSKA